MNPNPHHGRSALPAQVLALAVTAVIIVAVVRLAFPYVLPVRIVEGPLVQNLAGDEASLVWYTSRPVLCNVRLGDSPPRVAESAGTRNRLRLSGLSIETDQPYEILAGARRLHRAVLKPVKPPDAPFGFIVFGDSGRGSTQQYALARRMGELADSGASVDFLLHTGDVVYGAGQREDYRDRFFAPYRKLIDRICFWPALGNHDVSEPNPGQAYRDVFELPENGPSGLAPETNYWFDYGSLRVVVADTNLSEAKLASQVAPWMAAVFAKAPSSIRWRIAVFHHPPYTVGPHAGDKSRAVTERVFVPVLQAASVDIVFCGHDHLYQRTQPLWNGVAVSSPAPSSAALPGESGPPRGVVYVVSGAGGAKLYRASPPADRPPYFVKVIDNVHSFTHVTIDAASMHLRQIAISGEILDEFQLTGP